jgi:hypothetical protein
MWQYQSNSAKRASTASSKCFTATETFIHSHHHVGWQLAVFFLNATSSSFKLAETLIDSETKEVIVGVSMLC